MSATENHSAEKGGRLSSHALAVVWLAVLCTSTSAIFVRYSTAPSLVLAAYRKTIISLILLVTVLINPEYRREVRSVERGTLLWCLLSGFFLAIHFWTYFLSVKNTSIAASQVLVGTEVVFVALFLMITGREKMTRLGTAGIAVALAGGVVVAYTKGGMAASGMSGNIQAIIAAVMIVGYSLIGTRVRVNMSNTVYTLLVYGTSALVLNLMIPFSGYSFFGYGKINFLTAFLMAIFNSLLGHSLFNWSFKYISPTLVSICKLFQPVFTVTWALILFGEIPSVNQILGGVIVIGGIILYIRNRGARE